MSEQVSPFALTTAQRVYDRLGIQGATTAYTAVITRMVNSCSAFVEAECGDRKFVQRTYTNEIYSATMQRRQSYVELKQSPVLINSNYINQGPAGGITPITDFSFRGGAPDTPFWTKFLASNFELIDMVTYNDGNIYAESGIIRLYGYVPGNMDNMLRATYTAGYPVDWPNAGNMTTHLLPADLTDTVENLVVRAWKRRQMGGVASQSLQGSNVSWRNLLDDQDLSVIGHYSKSPIIM